MGYRVGVDVGGTFTDLVCVTPDGEIVLDKTPSTLDDQSRGVMTGLGQLADRFELSKLGAGVLSAAYPVGVLVGGIPSGIATGRFGPRAVTVAGKAVHLTPHQFELLRVLAVNKGKLLTHRTLLREVWGPGYGSESNLLHVNVSQLRRKIEPDRTRPRFLLTEPGAGYRLVEPA